MIKRFQELKINQYHNKLLECEGQCEYNSKRQTHSKSIKFTDWNFHSQTVQREPQFDGHSVFGPGGYKILLFTSPFKGWFSSPQTKNCQPRSVPTVPSKYIYLDNFSYDANQTHPSRPAFGPGNHLRKKVLIARFSHIPRTRIGVCTIWKMANFMIYIYMP